MTNVLSFPIQPSNDADLLEFKQLSLQLLDKMRAAVEAGDLTFIMILGQGPEADGIITWAGNLNHIAAQGLLAVTNRAVQDDMIASRGQP
jgi:hypothetical protein